MSDRIHLKGLNGLRAIAALAVVISHTVQNFGEFGLPKANGTDLAGFGVTIFFSLSGFLITYLLLLEKEKFRDVSIKQFYVRRILRIWPLYFFYILLSVIVLLIYQKEALPGSIIYYFFLAANIPFVLDIGLPLLYHFWSIGVEEQFYLFWPWMLKKTAKPMKWIIGVIIFMLFLKFFAWMVLQRTGNMRFYLFVHVTRFHCMAIGAAGAILYFKKNEFFLKLSFLVFTQIIAWGAILLCAFNQFHLASVIDNEIVSVLTVFLIVNVSANPKTLINLENWYMNYLGKVSYGIYVYHPLVIFLIIKLLGPIIKTVGTDYRYPLVYFLIIPLTILIAGLSYALLEKRFLLLKEKFSRVISSPNKVVSAKHL